MPSTPSTPPITPPTAVPTTAPTGPAMRPPSLNPCAAPPRAPADPAADRRAHDGADGARDAAALVESVRGPARHALRLRGKRRRHRCEKYAREYSQSHYPSLPGLAEARGLERQ